jgi:acetyl/propionyl-CoA carboxylase alpha subunit
MIMALSNYTILGIKTCIGFLSSVMEHPEFVAGNTQTDFIDKNMSDWKEEKKDKRFAREALIAAAISSQIKSPVKRRIKGKEDMPTPWFTVGKWSLGEK